MSVKIVYPEQRELPDWKIVDLYTTALALGRLPARHILARTPQAMADALDDIGVIRLQVNE